MKLALAVSLAASFLASACALPDEPRAQGGTMYRAEGDYITGSRLPVRNAGNSQNTKVIVMDSLARDELNHPKSTPLIGQ